jgi:hypothetical protein
MAENRKKTTYTTSYNTTSYDHSFSAVSYMFMDDGASMRWSPIFPEFIGKQPKKGENVFDHENGELFNFPPSTAAALLAQWGQLYDENVKGILHSSGNEEYGREIAIFRPKMVKLAGQHYDDFVVRLTITRKEEVKKMYHIFQHSSVKVNLMDKTSTEERVDVDLEIFHSFLEAVIRNAIGVENHAARRNASSGRQERGGSRAAAPQDIEEDDDESPTPAKSGGGKKGKPSQADVDSAFDE